MLGQIDRNLMPKQLELYLCKPNRTIIGKLKHSLNANLTVTLGQPYELSFDIPYQIDIQHQLKRNPNIDNVRVQFLIKVVYGYFTEWFVIDKITEAMSNDDKKTVHAYSLAYQLANKRLRNYQADSQTATQQLTTSLANTTWSVGYVDPSFDELHRGIDISSNSILEVVNMIVTTFNAMATFDTENKLVNLINPDTYGENKGLTFKYGKYLKSLGNDIDTSNMVTELKAYGQNDLTIGAVNPTGGDSIINLDFFMQGFERDDNKNVLSSSVYMSDGLCDAILNYNDLVTSKTDDYISLLSQFTNNQTTLTSKQTDLQNLQDQLKIAQDNLDLQRSAKTLSVWNFTYNGSTTNKSFTFDSGNYYIAMVKVASINNLTLTIDGSIKTLSPNVWQVVNKFTNKSSSTIQFSGSQTNNTINLTIVQITSDEYNSSINIDLLNKYNDKYVQYLINSKQKEVDEAQSNVDNVQSKINDIVESLSLENNFTSEQIEERDSFIITQEWSDSNYIDAQSLYDAAVKQLQSLQAPPTSITIDVVDFMQVVEAQREWDKLVLGDKVRVSYDLFNLDVSAQINQIQYDFETPSIKLTISNITEVNDDKKKFVNKIIAGFSASKSIDMSKYKWDTATDANAKIDNYISNPIDATKQTVMAGVNGSVTIDGRGITYTDPANQSNKVIAQAGQVSYSTDGGDTWKTAMTAQGTQAEQLIGKIILAEVLQMQNSSGNMTFDDNGLTLGTTDNTKRILINESDGIKIQQSPDGGTTWTDQFYVDSNGQLIARGIALYTPDGTATILDGTSQTIDFSNLKSILGQIIFNNDSGDTISDFGANSAGFNTLSVGQLTSPSIYNATFDDTNISVTSNVSAALHSIPPLNNGTAIITLQNDISENIDISNYLGDGTIEINLNGHKLNGNIYIHGCSPQYVHIHDGTVNGYGDTFSNAVVEIDRCTYVRLDNVKIYGNGNPNYGVYAHAGSGAYLATCEIYNVQEAISAATSASVTVDNCKGLGSSDGLHAFNGGYISTFGSQPGGSTSNTVASSGEVYPSGGTTVNTGAATPPSLPAQTTSWKSTNSGNWSSSGYWDSSPKQGNWGYGQRSGYWFFGSSPSSAVTGKTIQSMRIKVTRSSTGGYSSDVGIVIRSHNYTSQPSSAPSPTSESSYSTTVNLAWGESSWISLPSSFFADFQSGTAKGIGIYTSSTSKSDYAIMSGSATLEITYS